MTSANANPNVLSAANTPFGTLGTIDEFRLQLSNTLQSSLDLHEILAAFYQTLQKMVRCSGMEYRLPTRDIRLALGTHRAHKANYNLRNEHYAVGEMTFFRGARFSEEELCTLESVLGLLMQPLRNALLYREALENSLRDSLTGVGNRAALEVTLNRELKLSQRSRRPMSLLVGDLDDFNRVNDRLGQAAGGQMLQRVAATIQQVLRDTDQVFRYGGEEFVVVLGNTGNVEAVAIAERIRCRLETLELTTDREPARTTISIGVSSSAPDDDRDSLFERADAALHQAKHSGRNQVVNQPPVTEKTDSVEA